MSAFNPIPPRAAAELVDAAQIGDAASVLVDFAIAGRVKGYARLVEMVDARGARSEVRDGRIPVALWRRIVEAGKIEDVVRAGTVRLPGSGLIGGEPAVTIIGIRFDDASINALIVQHSAAARPAAGAKRSAKSPGEPVVIAAPLPLEPAAAPQPARRGPAAIPDGAVTVTIKQAMAALGLGRTTVDKLCGEGKLERIRVGGRALVTVESIRELAAGRS